jgi:chromate transport protein ChrA
MLLHIREQKLESATVMIMSHDSSRDAPEPFDTWKHIVRFPKYISELTFLPFLSDETDLASCKLTAVLKAQRCNIMFAILSQASYTITVVIKKNNSCLCSSTDVPLMRRKREERIDQSQAVEATTMQTPTQVSYSLWQLVRYFLRLGTLGFGGPDALVGYMQRDLVEQRVWIAEADYKEGLALAQLCPGPLAAQLAMYLGYVRYRTLGATLVGLAFIWPSFLMVVALGWLYTLYGGLPWMQAVFYGVGASVIGIVALSALKLTTRTIGRDPLLWGPSCRVMPSSSLPPPLSESTASARRSEPSSKA